MLDLKLFYLLKVNKIDIVLLVIILLILGYVFYITFIKHRHEPCHGCAHAKACEKLSSGEFCKKYREDREKANCCRK